jgi:hypothetical protein
MGYLAARLNLLKQAAQRPRSAALLKKLNLPIEILWGKIVFQNSARNFSFLRRDLKFNLTRSALHESLLSDFSAPSALHVSLV